jgi:hypothetical protein
MCREPLGDDAVGARSAPSGDAVWLGTLIAHERIVKLKARAVGDAPADMDDGSGAEAGGAVPVPSVVSRLYPRMTRVEYARRRASPTFLQTGVRICRACRAEVAETGSPAVPPRPKLRVGRAACRELRFIKEPAAAGE